MAARPRHWVVVAVSAIALSALAAVDISSYASAGASPLAPAAARLHVLIEWPDGPAMALRITPFEPLAWALLLSLLSVALAAYNFSRRILPASQAVIFVLAAAAYGAMFAGTYRTLAVLVVLFDGVAALMWLVRRQPGRAVGRLLLGVLTGAAVMAGGINDDLLRANGLYANTLFSLAVWLRLGLYPLLESESAAGTAPPIRLSWSAVNLALGLYLVSVGVAPWVAWVGLVTTLLHGALAWMEPRREKALVHVACTLAGSVLVAAALSMDSAGMRIASVNLLMCWLALALMPMRLGWPVQSHPTRVLQHLWGYLPPLLATCALVGLPLTLGWPGRAALFQVIWSAGGPGMLALVVIAEGAALSVLYRYWSMLLQEPGDARPALWRKMGATAALVPFLIPLLGVRFVSLAVPAASDLPPLAAFDASAWVGLAGSLLWAVFLGYGRRWLPLVGAAAQEQMMEWLRLGWLLRRTEWALQTVSRTLLRVRSVIEGEHYLAWAVLLAICIGLLIVFYPSALGG
jgi:hypothetical protein